MNHMFAYCMVDRSIREEQRCRTLDHNQGNICVSRNTHPYDRTFQLQASLEMILRQELDTLSSKGKFLFSVTLYLTPGRPVNRTPSWLLWEVNSCLFSDDFYQNYITII